MYATRHGENGAVVSLMAVRSCEASRCVCWLARSYNNEREGRLTLARKATNTRARIGYYTAKRSICFVEIQSIDGCLSGSHHYEPSHCALHSWQDATSTAGCAAKECGGLELDCSS
jgi:hypothetical protein